LTDFSIAANREGMQDALDWVKKSLGRDYPLVIHGRPV
jgi:hypothetical protein